MIVLVTYNIIYDGVRRVSGLRRDLTVSAEDPTHPTEKQIPTLSLQVLCGLLITYNF